MVLYDCVGYHRYGDLPAHSGYHTTLCNRDTLRRGYQFIGRCGRGYRDVSHHGVCWWRGAGKSITREVISMKKRHELIVKLPSLPSSWVPVGELLQLQVDIVDTVDRRSIGKMALSDLIKKVR